MPNVSRTTEIRHVQFDTNYWKTFVHARLATTPGDRSCLTLYGNPRGSANEHRLFAEHIAGSEVSTVTEGHGRVVREWALRPSRPDNHWFDCLVGTAVAASMCGVRLGVESVEPQKAQKRVRLSELQRQRA